ncbi:MAG: outer membrane lipid asymmetry maintenance protein MlaD [Lentisphaerae bacterium]|nr:outer membrane lipid asymmetry maintenance protein MlaD [Lentisphaerota bacterium]
MRHRRLVEILVGIFVVAGVLALAHLSIGLARREVVRGQGYTVKAIFSDVGGLRTGASVTVAGVEIGRVARIALTDYQGEVLMSIDGSVKLQADSIASIRTRGLIGEKLIAISPGGDDELLVDGGAIVETEPAVDLEQMISKFVFGKKD